MMAKLIVDISHHQLSSTINWEKAAKEVAFMIIRVQYGSLKEDTEYKKHVANCKKYNIPFGHYAYARFVSVADAKVEVNDFLSRIDKAAKFLVVDVEEQTCKKSTDLVPATQAFIDSCKKADYKTGLYTGNSFYKDYNMNKVKSDFLWVARYGTSKPAVPCDLWQYTESGKVSWYAGNLDLSSLNGDKTLEWFLGAAKANEDPITV